MHGAMPGMQHDGIKMEEDKQESKPMKHDAETGSAKEALGEEMKKTSEEMKKTSEALKQKSDAMPAAISYYTCPMHPQIHQDKPGKCPICGMTLVKKEGKPPK
jgi:rubrerythrin